MTGFSTRLGLLFLLALVGVLAVIGLVLGSALGTAAALLYAGVVLALLAVGSVVARRQQRAARLTAGHTCTCCTGTVHDPVQVL